MHYTLEYLLQNSTTYSQKKGWRGLKTGYMMQVGDEGDAFDDQECWRRGTYHKTTMFYSLETLKNSAQHVFQPLFHFPVPPAR